MSKAYTLEDLGRRWLSHWRLTKDMPSRDDCTADRRDLRTCMSDHPEPQDGWCENCIARYRRITLADNAMDSLERATAAYLDALDEKPSGEP